MKSPAVTLDANKRRRTIAALIILLWSSTLVLIMRSVGSKTNLANKPTIEASSAPERLDNQLIFAASIVTVSSFGFLIIAFLAKIILIVSYCHDMHVLFLIPNLMNTGDYVVFLAIFYVVYLVLPALAGLLAIWGHKADHNSKNDLKKKMVVGLLVVLVAGLVWMLRQYHSTLLVTLAVVVQALLVSIYFSDKSYKLTRLNTYHPAGWLVAISAFVLAAVFESSPLKNLPGLGAQIVLWVLVFLYPPLVAIASLEAGRWLYKPTRPLSSMISIAIFLQVWVITLLATSNYFAQVSRRAIFFAHLGNYEVLIRQHADFPSPRADQKLYCVIAAVENQLYVYPIESVMHKPPFETIGPDFFHVHVPSMPLTALRQVDQRFPTQLVYTNKMCPALIMRSGK